MDKIRRFLRHVRRQIDRRILNREVIPHGENVFSMFKEHVRWISNGKAGCPVEPGVPVCVIARQSG